MNKDEIYFLTEQEIAKFTNGRDRYYKSPLFNKIIQMLVSGMSVYDVIDELVKVNENTLTALEQYMARYNGKEI